MPFGRGVYDCSKKIVQHWVFYICAKFCQKFDIFLSPGSHKPSVQLEKDHISLRFGYEQLITRAKIMSMTNVTEIYIFLFIKLNTSIFYSFLMNL